MTAVAVHNVQPPQYGGQRSSPEAAVATGAASSASGQQQPQQEQSSMASPLISGPRHQREQHAIANGGGIANLSHPGRRNENMTMNHHGVGPAPSGSMASTMAQSTTHRHPLHQHQHQNQHEQHQPQQRHHNQQQHHPNGGLPSAFTHPESNSSSSNAILRNTLSNTSNGGTTAGQGGNYVNNGSHHNQATINSHNSRAATLAGSTTATAAPAGTRIVGDPPINNIDSIDNSSGSRRPSSAPGNGSNGLPTAAAAHRIAADASGSDDSDPDNADQTMTRRRASKPTLMRSKSERGLRRDESDDDDDDDLVDENGPRHGFEDHYQSEEFVSQLANNWCMYYTDNRHESTGKPKTHDFEVADWRMRDRLKTVSAALAVCLNIGVEPPDQLRTSPGAKLEAWHDPSAPPLKNALETIGKVLQQQYTVLAGRTRYKQYLDPSVEETKKFCISLRRNAKDERVLFHYNGHGVPKPTSSGEIWVFNKSYTQYIPVSLYDLQHWLQAPTIFVWDCSEAGNILTNYDRFVDKHEIEEKEAAARDPTYDKINFRPYIHLAACKAKENLPTNPQLPADLFTCCLTTPVETALWFFVLQNPLKTDLAPERAKTLPGTPHERRSPLGELNWIFTAITDTIAWTTLPRALFRQYFRQDLMVAALFRNFLLAQRIMSVYGCHPRSHPELPDTRQHPLWESWDLAVDMALAQLPMIERKEAEGGDFEYQSSSFFTEQLTAFEVYLTRGDAMDQKAPAQLPILLQVLLSQQHRVRALILLSGFLDLGPWAVQLALSIGIFPYVLKLLQSTAAELKPVMVFIWTRVLAVDISCQGDLIKDSGYQYFAQILRPSEGLPLVDGDEHKAMCAFILSMVCKGPHRGGQTVCNQSEVMTFCLAHLGASENMLLRQWACLCISQLWEDFPDAKWRGIREGALAALIALKGDHYCDVRAAMLHAMTTFLGMPDLTDEVVRNEESAAWSVLDMANDGSPMVRKELLVFFSHFVLRYENKFIVAAYEQLQEEKEYVLFMPSDTGTEHKMGLHYARPENRNQDGTIKPSAYGLSHNSLYAAIWKHLMVMTVDPHPEVQRDASIIVNCIHNALLESPVGAQAHSLMVEVQRKAHKAAHKTQASSNRNSFVSPIASDTTPEPSPGLLKRTASFFFSQIMPQEKPTPPPSPGLNIKRLSTATRIVAPEDQNSEATGGQATYHTSREPVSGSFQGRNMKEMPTLPLKSTFLDWSIEYFREAQMRPNESEEPGSTEYNKRLWRRSRNEAVLRETQPQKQHAGSHKWDNQFALLDNKSQPTRIAFHQFEDHMAVADDGNTVTIWDWQKPYSLNKFSNGNPEGSKISDMKFINEDDQAFLMTGSSDGVVRVYRSYESSNKMELATSWRALTHMVPSNVNSGMVFDWQQVTGRVLVAGDVRVIRVWAAAYETCIMDIPARSGSCVTSLTSDQMTGNMFVAGFGDGAVRVFDTRCHPQDSMVQKWKDDDGRQWIKSVHMQRGGQRELVSASRNGKVKLWDIRKKASPIAVIRTTKETLRTASVHEHLPVFAVGTSGHLVKVFNFFPGEELSRYEPYTRFLQQNRVSPISATAFHPHKMILGCAARGDNHINIIACEQDKTSDRFMP